MINNSSDSSSHIIPAVLSENDFKKALFSKSKYIFLLHSSILELPKYSEQAYEAEKRLFVHLDMAEGIGKDHAGIQFLSKCKVFGMISTRTHMIKIARECSLATVQRFFIVDSRSLDTALETIPSSKPDMVEVMPGVVPKIINRFTKKNDIPIIAGGLIQTKEDVFDALSAGASAVSTTRSELWNI